MRSPLCVIPARGGSKRLPRKNILPLRGHPVLAYTIAAAQRSELFDAVYVATEDAEIGAIAREYGATEWRIPAEMAGDLVSSSAPMEHLYAALREGGAAFDALYLLQPSSPLRAAQDILNAWEIFAAGNHDSLVSMTFVDPHYFHWAIAPAGDNGERYAMHFGAQYLRQRSELPPVYRPNGAIKISRPEPLLRLHHFFGENMAGYEMPEVRSVHLATDFELQVAETILRNGLARPDLPLRMETEIEQEAGVGANR